MLTAAMSEEPNISVAVSSADSVVKTEHVDTKPSPHDESERTRESGDNFWRMPTCGHWTLRNLLCSLQLR